MPRWQSISRPGQDPQDNRGGIVDKAEVERLIAHFGLASVEELMLLALPAARQIARPPISDFHVGAVGLETETGNLVLGGNVEFPGTHLGATIHGEGFVFTRAFSRGTSIEHHRHRRGASMRALPAVSERVHRDAGTFG